MRIKKRISFVERFFPSVIHFRPSVSSHIFIKEIIDNFAIVLKENNGT